MSLKPMVPVIEKAIVIVIIVTRITNWKPLLRVRPRIFKFAPHAVGRSIRVGALI